MTLTADRAERTIASVRRLCATATAETDLLVGVAARVRPAVPCDTAVWFCVDPSTLLFTDASVDGFDASTCAPWFHHELTVDDVHLFRDLPGRGPAVLSRTLADPSTSPRWRDLMRPLGLDAEVRMTMDDPRGTWGALEMHREVGSGDFDDDETALLAGLAPVVAGGLRRLAVERRALATQDVDGPGLVLVAPDGTVTPGTPAGAAWLELLSPEGGMPVPASLLTLSALAAAPDDRPRRARVRALDGRWVTLHAAPLTSGAGSAIIVEPSGPSDVADLFVRAHGLTRRERETALGLARGETTAALAARLHLSQHTVRDHLKAVFRKVGVSSRSELVAHLFVTYCADRLFDARPTSHPHPKEIP